MAMDFKIWVEFEEERYDRFIHADDVVTVEAPFELQEGIGNVLLESDDKEIWGRITRSEIKKVEHYWPDRVYHTDRIRVEARAIRRGFDITRWTPTPPPESKLIKWLGKKAA